MGMLKKKNFHLVGLTIDFNFYLVQKSIFKHLLKPDTWLLEALKK